MMSLPSPYLLFVGDVTEPGYAKTAFGLRDWAGDLCIGEYACSDLTDTTTASMKILNIAASPSETRS